MVSLLTKCSTLSILDWFSREVLEVIVGDVVVEEEEEKEGRKDKEGRETLRGSRALRLRLTKRGRGLPRPALIVANTSDLNSIHADRSM